MLITRHPNSLDKPNHGLIGFGRPARSRLSSASRVVLRTRNDLIILKKSRTPFAHPHFSVVDPKQKTLKRITLRLRRRRGERSRRRCRRLLVKVRTKRTYNLKAQSNPLLFLIDDKKSGFYDSGDGNGSDDGDSIGGVNKDSKKITKNEKR